MAHPLVRKVAFTGGEIGGRKVYEAAAKTSKGNTRLGGKIAVTVFADANLDNPVKVAISGIFAARGKPALAGSRLFVQNRSTRVHAAPSSLPLRRESAIRRSRETQSDQSQPNRNIERPQLHRCGPPGRRQDTLGGERPTIQRSKRVWFVSQPIFGNVRQFDSHCARRSIRSPSCRSFHFPTKTRRSRLATISPMD